MAGTGDKLLTAAEIKEVTDTKVNISDVVNALNSTSTNKPLSAAQGKALNDAKVNKTDTIAIEHGGTNATSASNARTNLDVYSKSEVDTAIAQSTANLQGLTVYNMTKSDGTEETNKPWLVIKRLIESMPTGNLVGRISAGSIYCYYGYKYNNSYASFIVDIYTKTAGPYKVVLENGSWSYASINVDAYNNF